MQNLSIHSSYAKDKRNLLIHAVATVVFFAMWIMYGVDMKFSFWNLKMLILVGYFGFMSVKYARNYWGPKREVLLTESGIFAGGRIVPWANIKNIYVRLSSRPAYKEVCVEMVDSNDAEMVINEEDVDLSADELAKVLLDTKASTAI